MATQFAIAAGTVFGGAAYVTKHNSSFARPTANLRSEFKGKGEPSKPDTTVKLRFGNASPNIMHISKLVLHWAVNREQRTGSFAELVDELKMENTLLSSSSSLDAWDGSCLGSTMIVLATLRPLNLGRQEDGEAWSEACHTKLKEHEVRLEVQHASPGWFGGINGSVVSNDVFFLPIGPDSD